MPTSSHGTPNDRMAKAWGEALFLPQAVIPQIVPGRGLEPLRISPPDPKSGASANSATPAKSVFVLAQILAKPIPHTRFSLGNNPLNAPNLHPGRGYLPFCSAIPRHAAMNVLARSERLLWR